MVSTEALQLPSAASEGKTRWFSGRALYELVVGDTALELSLGVAETEAAPQQVMRASKLYETISHAWFVFITPGDADAR